MGVRRVPEAGSGSAETVRVSVAGTTWREAHRVGARTGVDGGMPELTSDGGEYRAAGAIFRVEKLGVERSNSA